VSSQKVTEKVTEWWIFLVKHEIFFAGYIAHHAWVVNSQTRRLHTSSGESQKLGKQPVFMYPVHKLLIRNVETHCERDKDEGDSGECGIDKGRPGFQRKC
jgi:hypothetical protein